jgi:prophage regulatory protein
MRQHELLEILPFSAASLWRKVNAGTFVQPVRLSARVTAWNRAKVQEWLASKEAA